MYIGLVICMYTQIRNGCMPLFYDSSSTMIGSTSTRQKLMHCDIWAMVYDVLQQRTGQTLWSHQYDHSRCPFNDKADALAKQAAATPPLQLGPCVLQRTGEPLAPSASRNVRPQGNAEGASGRWSVLAPQQPKGIAKTERAFAPLRDPAMTDPKEVQHQCKRSNQHRCHNKLSQCIRVMVGKGTSNRQVGRCPAATQKKASTPSRWSSSR